MVIAIVLSLGAIYAFIPIVIILILIGAAVGLTRGTDIFAALGIGALIGIGATTGKGGTGKGIAGPKVPKSTILAIKAQGSKAGGAIKASAMKKSPGAASGAKALGAKISKTAAVWKADRIIRAEKRRERIEALAAGTAVVGLAGEGKYAPGAALPIGTRKAAIDAVAAGRVRFAAGEERRARRAAKKTAIATEKTAIRTARNGFTVKPGDPRLRFRGMQILPTKGMIRSERQHALSSGGTRSSFQFQFPGAYQVNIIGKFIGGRVGSRLPASSIAGSNPLVEGGIRSRALELKEARTERKEARMERQDARTERRANERVVSEAAENLQGGKGFGDRQPGINVLNQVMGVRYAEVIRDRNGEAKRDLKGNVMYQMPSMFRGVTGSDVEDEVSKEKKAYSNYWDTAQKEIAAVEKITGKKSKEKPMSYAAWDKAERSEAQPPPPPSPSSQNKQDVESLRSRLQGDELHKLQVKMENLTSQKRLEEIDAEKGKISAEMEKLHAEGTPEALAMVAKLSDRVANLSDRAAELSRRAMKNSEKAVEVSSQLEEAEAKANLKSQQKSWYDEKLEKRLEKLDARAEGGSDAAASKAVKLREWMAKREAAYGQEASGASEARQTGAEQDAQDKKPDKSKSSGKTKEGESTVDELREKQARDEEVRRQEEDRRKRQEAQEESERKAHK